MAKSFKHKRTFKVVRGGANYWLLKRKIYGGAFDGIQELSDVVFGSKKAAAESGRRWKQDGFSAEANNPKLFSFQRYYAECDGKRFGPFKTKAKARKVGAAIARVMMKPCRILGEAKNPCHKRKTKSRSRTRTRRRSTR